MNWTASQQQVFPIAYGVIILIAIILGVFLNNKSEKVKNIPFLIITIIILVAEVVKQIRGIALGYSLWSIPLHFCSTFLIWFTLASFFKGKVSRVGHAISFVTCLAFLIGFIVGPSTIIGAATDNLTLAWSNFSNLHTFYYHFMVVLFLALQISLRIKFPTLKDLKFVAIPFFSWMAVAAIVGNIINVNFSNVLYNNVGFMDAIRINYGYPIYLISLFAMFFVICIAMLSVGSLIDMLKRKVRKETSPKLN